MAELYRLDPNARISWYADREDFVTKTRDWRDHYRKYHGGADRKGYAAPWLES
jgi:hypothetical protein